MKYIILNNFQYGRKLSQLEELHVVESTYRMDRSHMVVRLHNDFDIQQILGKISNAGKNRNDYRL